MAGRGGRRLAAGHGVDQVVDADHLEVHVAARGVDEVVAADGEQVAVAGVHHHVQLRDWPASGRWRRGWRVRGWCGTNPGSRSRRRGRCSRCRRRWPDFFRSTLESSSARAKQLTVVPMPQPGHQMCGMRSMRRNGSTRDSTRESVLIGSPPRWPSGCRRDRARCRRRAGRERFWQAPCAARSTSSTIWPRFSSGTTNAFTFCGQLADALFRERPGRDQPQLADLQPLPAGHLNGPLRHARGDAVGDHHHVGVVEMLGLVQRPGPSALSNLGTQALDQFVLDGGRSCWDSRARRGSGR